MILSIKRDQFWSFWCQGWSNHQNQEIRAVEVGEANEVAEADEVYEAAKVVRPEKSVQRTSGSLRVLKSALF